MKKKHFKVKSMQVNALLNTVYALLNVIFPLVTYPYVSRILNAGGMGKVNFFTSVAIYGAMFSSLGIGTYGIRAVARTRENYDELSKTVQELLTINLIGAFTVSLLYIALLFIIPKFRNNSLLFIFSIIWVLIAPCGLDWLFQGLEQYGYITNRNFIFKVISIILMFALVRNRNDYVSYFFIILFSNLGNYIINFVYAHRFIDFRHRFKLQLMKHMKPTLILFASTLAVNVYNNLDIIMLGFIRDDRQVGLYTTATKIETVLLSIVTAISASLLPRLSLYIKEKRYEEFNNVLNKTISIVLAITVSLTAFFIIMARDCIYILGGTDFLPATLSMQLLMPILIISGFSNITGNQILIPTSKERYFLLAVSMGALIDVILNMFLMKPFGANGASLATLIAEFTQMSIQFHFAKKDIIGNVSWMSLRKIFLSAFLSTILLITTKICTSLNVILELCLCGTVFFGSFLMFLLIFREPNITEGFRNIKERI